MKSQSRERLSYVGESLLRLAFKHASSIHSVRCFYKRRLASISVPKTLPCFDPERHHFYFFKHFV